MERIYLTKSQKELIRKIHSNNNIYCNVRQEDYNDLTILEEKKLLKIRVMKGEVLYILILLNTVSHTFYQTQNSRIPLFGMIRNIG